MSDLALYTLAGQYQQLAEKLSELDLDAATIADTIESTGLTDSIAKKAAGIEMVARTMEMYNHFIESEIHRLKAVLKQRQRKADGLRDYLLENMEAAGISRIDAPLFTIRVQNNAPAVDVYDQRMIPAVYMTQPPTPELVPNKKYISAVLKTGQDIPGVKLATKRRLVID